MPSYNMAIGLTKGHKTTKNVTKARPSRRKGVSIDFFICIEFINTLINL